MEQAKGKEGKKREEKNNASDVGHEDAVHEALRRFITAGWGIGRCL